MIKTHEVKGFDVDKIKAGDIVYLHYKDYKDLDKDDNPKVIKICGIVESFRELNSIMRVLYFPNLPIRNFGVLGEGTIFELDANSSGIVSLQKLVPNLKYLN